MKNLDAIKKEFISKCSSEKTVDEILKSKKYHRLFPRHDPHHHKIENISDIPWSVKLYEEYKVPIYKLAMVQGVSDTALREAMIRHGCNMRGHRCGRNSDNTYFETIDSPDKAYFLGLIIADGAITQYKKCLSFSISLLEEDKYILERFNKVANLNTELVIEHKEDIKPRYKIQVSSSKMVEDLLQYGIVRNKSHKDTYIPYALVPDSLIPHLIRGYYDGDGIAYKQGYVGFCGSKTFVKQVHDYFVKKHNFNDVSITYNKSNHIYYTTWASKKDTKAFIDIIYKDCESYYLTRKKEKIEQRFKGQ